MPVGAGGTVHDYVPFYFCSKNPMLLSVLNTKNVDQQHILFLCLGIDILNREGTVFTDASANTKVPPNFFDDPEDLDKLDWAAINSLKWGSKSDEERHHRMAELLVHNHVDIKDIGHIVVWNWSMKKSVIETFEQKDVEPPEVHIESFNGRWFFFSSLQPGKDGDSIITGPFFMKQAFEETIEEINKKRKEQEAKDDYPYADIEELLNAIEEDFSALTEMADIDGLKVTHAGSTYVVSDRTSEMAENIKSDGFYRSCDETDQEILLLSAYLHGIGKAPIEVVDGKTHQVYADYPKDSVEKLIRLLTEEVADLTAYQLRKICLLVGYHDLVGDIILHHRNEEQLFDLIEDETEVDMLIAIGLAGFDKYDFIERSRIKTGSAALREKAISHLDGDA